MNRSTLVFASLAATCVLGLAAAGIATAQGAPADVPGPGVTAAPVGTKPAKPSPLEGFNMGEYKETRATTWRVVVPEAVLTEQRDSRIAAQRLSFAFEGGTSALELSYEDERADAPVVAVFIDSKISDTELSAETFRNRRNRAAELNFQVKSIPSNFGAFTVVVEHWHVTAAGETLVGRPFERADCPTYQPIAVAIPGLLPGVNRYRLRVRRTDGRGVTTTSEGVSHFVTVHEVAALGLRHAFDAVAVKSAVAGVDLYDATTRAVTEFTLSPAIDAEGARLRISRRGRRDYNVAGLPTGLRGAVDAPLFQQAWKTVTEVPLAALDQPEVSIEALGGRKYRVTLRHSLAVSGSILPVNDAWEYSLSLHHPLYSSAVDACTLYAGGAITKEAAEVRFGANLDSLTTKPFESR